jgi:hypothetical protein
MDTSPLDARKVEDRPIRDIFPRSRAAVGVCDLPLLGLLLVGAGTTAGVSCSFKVQWSLRIHSPLSITLTYAHGSRIGVITPFWPTYRLGPSPTILER